MATVSFIYFLITFIIHILAGFGDTQVNGCVKFYPSVSVIARDLPTHQRHFISSKQMSL